MSRRKIVFMCTLFLFVLLISCRKSRRHAMPARSVHIEQQTEVSTSSDYEEDPSSDELDVVEDELDKKKDDKIIDNADENILIPKIKVDLQSHILYRIAYVTSYNSSTRNPNWVAWELTREHTDGSYPRKGVPYYAEDGSVLGIGNITVETFRNGYFVDQELEGPRQEHSDWQEHPTNIEHGHMCPAADNKWDKAAMNQSFLLTNMCPQDGTLNGGGWKKLEEKCRSWAIRYGQIYIIAGPVYSGNNQQTFGVHKIPIPDAFFKVVLCLQGKPKAIGFFYNNDSSNQPMRNQVRSVDEIESITGFDFFSSLPDELEDAIEALSDFGEWR